MSFLAQILCLAVFALAQDSVVINVTTDVISAPVPSNAVGLSYEVPLAQPMFGFAGVGPRHTFANMMLTLLRASGGPQGPEIRIGGDSSDSSAYLPNASIPLPAGSSYRLNGSDLASWAAAVPLWNGTVTPGLTFRYGTNYSLGVQYAQALLSSLGSSSSGILRAVELGNEPDLYFRNGVRPSTYTRQQYASEWAGYVQAVQAAALGGVGPAVPVQGGVFCCNETGFDLSAASLLPASAAWSEHFYPLNAPCFKGKNSVWDLLTQEAASARSAALAGSGLLAQAAALGVPVLYGEMNSVACGGQANVSDVFASALWAVDAMMEGVAVGIRGFRYHTGDFNQPYSPLGLGNVHNPNDPLSVRPLFYGMWAFAVATAHGAALLQSPYASSDALIKAWATYSNRTGVTTVVIIHKNGNATRPANVRVYPPPGGPPINSTGLLLTLSPGGDEGAGGVMAKTGLVFGGLTFDHNTHGIPLNATGHEDTVLKPTPVQLDADGSSCGCFTLTVQPASLALLTYARVADRT